MNFLFPHKNIKLTFLFILLSYGLLTLYIWNHINIVRNFVNNDSARLDSFLTENDTNNTVIFLGNSLVEQYNLNDYYKSNYKNRGIGGDMTGGILYRIDEVINRKPNIIVLLIGINDISRGISTNTIVQNYSKILGTIKKSNPNCLVYTISILPVRKAYSIRRFFVDLSYYITFVRSYNINYKVNEVNLSIQHLSKKYGYQFLNLNSQFVTLGDSGFYLNPDLASDNVHLNKKGYQLLTELIIKNTSLK